MGCDSGDVIYGVLNSERALIIRGENQKRRIIGNVNVNVSETVTLISNRYLFSKCCKLFYGEFEAPAEVSLWQKQVILKDTEAH